MAKQGGVGVPAIIAVAIVSTMVTIVLDKLGITTKVQAIVEKVV